MATCDDESAHYWDSHLCTSLTLGVAEMVITRPKRLHPRARAALLTSQGTTLLVPVAGYTSASALGVREFLQTVPALPHQTSIHSSFHPYVQCHGRKKMISNRPKLSHFSLGAYVSHPSLPPFFKAQWGVSGNALWCYGRFRKLQQIMIGSNKGYLLSLFQPGVLPAPHLSLLL